MLYFLAVLDLVHENLSGFKGRNIMLIDNQCSITGNIPGDFLLAFFVDKTSKATNVDVIATGHGAFNDAEECLDRSCNIGFVYSCLFRDFVNDVCFRHNGIFKVLKFSGGQI